MRFYGFVYPEFTSAILARYHQVANPTDGRQTCVDQYRAQIHTLVGAKRTRYLHISEVSILLDNYSPVPSARTKGLPTKRREKRGCAHTAHPVPNLIPNIRSRTKVTYSGRLVLLEGCTCPGPCIDARLGSTAHVFLSPDSPTPCPPFQHSTVPEHRFLSIPPSPHRFNCCGGQTSFRLGFAHTFESLSCNVAWSISGFDCRRR